MNDFIIPKAIDIIPTARCNMICPMCWGPPHDIKDKITTEEWKTILKKFKSWGTKKVIFTGGEPLLRYDIEELISYAKNLGFIITLSTNTLALKAKWEILKYIDQIGIPIDGSTKEINSLVRIGNQLQFDSAIYALKNIKTHNPNIEVTVRTVANKQNFNDLENINSLLEKYLHNFDRWKIYQFTPINYGKINSKILDISKKDFVNICNKIKSYSKISIKSYLSENRANKYVFINSDGNIYGVNKARNYQSIGNILTENFLEIIKKLSNIYNNNLDRD